tara:strand:+ start:1195 stop:1521 length:327 start_codon:yes stop_codon:yes gene_type:complete
MTEARNSNDMNVKIVRLSTSEDVIADVIEENEKTITFRGAIVAVPTKDGNIGFASWCPLLNSPVDDITVKQEHIIYVNDPADQVVDHYKNQFSKIVRPDSIQDGIIVP